MSAAYLTTYRNDYPKKQVNVKFYHVEKRPTDIIAEPFTNYLCIKKTNIENPYEDWEEYYEKFAAKNPHLVKKYFTPKLNAQYIKTAKITTYRKDYGKADRKKAQKVVDEDGDFPMMRQKSISTYQSEFRDPFQFNKLTKGKEPPRASEQHEQRFSLGEYNFRPLLSEYGAKYNSAGAKIIEHQLLGKIVHAPCTCLEHSS